MATDIILDDGGQERITLAATAVKTTASDFIMDSPVRHTGKPGLRRALVHDPNDGLTLNYNGDYPGGVKIVDANLRLRIHAQVGTNPVLPKRANVGDVYAVVCISPLSEIGQEVSAGRSGQGNARSPVAAGLGSLTVEGIAAQLSPSGENISLWLCVRGGSSRLAYWREIPLGTTIKGSG